MNAEIISVGTELVLGQVLNTNAPYLARQLGELDIEADSQLTIPDKLDQLKATVADAWQHFDLVFVCGGLGPTADDITMPGVAAGLQTALQTDEEYWQWIQDTFKERQEKMMPENIRQAKYLVGGEPIKNPVGLALGSWYQQGSHCLIVLPGPPAEFKAMVDQEVMPKLKDQFVSGQQIVSRTLHFFGNPESKLMDEIADATADLHEIVITSYVQPAEIQVRMTIHDQAPQRAKQLLDEAQRRIIKAEAPYYFGAGDQVSLAQSVVALLKQKGLRITAAESLTGGMFQSTICSVPGASDVFDGGFVTYAASAKEKMLWIDSQVIDQYGVVSSQTAAAMARNSREQLQVDVGLGFTGVAGPDSLEGHPAGDVWIGLAIAGRPVETHELHLAAYTGRQSIREQAVQYGLQMVYRALQK